MSEDKKRALWNAVVLFMEEQSIGCSEDVYQSDRVIINAYEFIDGLCSIVGYPESEDEE